MTNIIINRNSGTVLRLGESHVRGLIEKTLGHEIGMLEFLTGAEISPRLKTLVGSESRVLVGGGDGTAVAAAEILSGSGTPFGILPLGTMNLLAQDLGSASTFEDTLARFAGLREEKIDAGLCNGRMFLCSAVVGFVPEGAVAREALRENVTLGNIANFLGTIAGGIGGDIHRTLHLKSHPDDKPYALDTTALIVSNNKFAKFPENADGRFQRQSITDGKLAVYAASPKNMMDGLRLAFSVWQGDWQEHDTVMSFEAPSLIVDTGERKTLVSLDGEPLEMTGPLEFSIRRKSIPVLRFELSA